MTDVNNHKLSNVGGSTPNTPKKDTSPKSSPAGCQAPTEDTRPTLENGKLVGTEVEVSAEVKTKAKKLKIKTQYRPILDYQKCLDKLGIRYRMHAYLGVQISLDRGKTWEGCTKELEAEIYQRVVEGCDMLVYASKEGSSKKEWVPKPANFAAGVRSDATLALLSANRYDPLLEWINGLPTERCDEAGCLLEKVFDLPIIERYKTEEDNLLDGVFETVPFEVSRYYSDVLMLIVKGIVKRTLEPGSSFPFFPIFLGDQGCGKSYFLQLLLPPDIADLAFVDNLDMSLPTKEKEQVLRDAAVVECSELAGRNGQRDVAEHKAFVTTKISKIRLPYSRFPEQVRRRAVPIGTSNDDECLPRDPTGDRRSIIVMVARKKGWSKKDVEMNMPKIVGEWRDRLFSHAKWLLAQGEGCSYRHWTESSLQLREELIGEAEKRSYHLEIAIDDLISELKFDSYGNPDELMRIGDKDKEDGVPLQVPMDCKQWSIMRLIKYNTAKSSNVARNLSARMVADTLKKKGWTSQKRRLKSGKSNPVAHWKPPAK